MIGAGEGQAGAALSIRRKTELNETAQSPRISSDEHHISFAISRSGVLELYVLEVMPTGVPGPTTRVNPVNDSGVTYPFGLIR